MQWQHCCLTSCWIFFASWWRRRCSTGSVRCSWFRELTKPNKTIFFRNSTVAAAAAAHEQQRHRRCFRWREREKLLTRIFAKLRSSLSSSSPSAAAAAKPPINKVRDSRLTAEFFSVLFRLYFSPIFFSSVPWQQRFRRLRRCRRRRCCCCCRCAPQTLNNRIKLRPPLRQQPMANRGTAPARLKSPRLSTEKDGLIGRETPAIIRQSCIKMHRAGTDSRKCEKPFA